MEAGNQLLFILLTALFAGAVGYQILRSKVFEPRHPQIVDGPVVKEGWRLEPKAKTSLTNKYKNFPFFENSMGKEVRNVIRGKVNGISVIAFDYHSFKKVHDEYRRAPQLETVIIVELYGIDLPTFALAEPSTLEPPTAQFEIFDNVGLYRLEGLDGQAVQNLITSDIVSAAPAFNVQSVDGKLLYYRGWRRSNPRVMADEIHQCITFAEILAKRVASNLSVYEFAA